MNGRWIEGNDIRLLENGEEFFPRAFACIANAEREVVLETFILFEDKVGLQLHEALVAAARRGVQVDVTIDGFGSDELSERFMQSLAEAGVRMHVFDPGKRLFGKRFNVLRRMHRKIVVVDGTVAFVGGINYSADHLADFGPEAKQDYSVRVEGPIVAEIRTFARNAIAVPD
ncbi:MAG TPA: cardiolipin synthase ClsB, partial [Nevskia sp.]|nr:cardiolipin synthase ClsB [Nevskia sp.]